jgi:uncharacterized delta-60 repeat protein
MEFKNFFSLAAFAMAPTFLFAQAGTLDGDFDGDGRVTTALLSGDNKANCLAIQPNGYIVAAGSTISSGAGASTNYAMVRYRPDGSLDNTFSLNGKADFGIAPAADDDAEAIAILPDGKFLVAGNSATASGTRFSALLLNPNGTSFDGSFGTNGKLLLESVNFIFSSMVIQPDGKIVAAGYSNNGQNFDFTVLRLLANGTLDNTFSGDGRAVIPIGPNTTDFGFAVALQPDGKILVAGSSYSTARAMALVRLNPNGSLDNSFSFDGKLNTLIGSSSTANAVIVQSDGKIVVAGQIENTPGVFKDMALVRYNPDGTLDPNFQGDGRRTIALQGDDLGIDLLLQSDGKLILIGASGGEKGMVAVRLMPDGSNDVSFGLAGFAFANFDEFATPTQAVITPNNRLVIAGYKRGGNSYFEFALAQFLLGLIVVAEDLDNPGAKLIYPNPIKDQAVFEYELPQNGMVTLALFDLQGRMMYTFLTNEPRSSGKNTELLQFPTETPNGTYFLQIKTEAGSATVKIQKL